MEDQDEMKCLECGHEMQSRVGNWAYKESGLSNITLQNITIRRCPSCGEEEMDIPRIAELHQLIAAHVSKKPERLTPPEIRFLRTHLGWSGADFARKLGVTPETVSRWEKGSAPMGLGHEKALRLCIALLQQGQLQPVDDYWLEHLSDLASQQPKSVRLYLSIQQERWQAIAA